MAANKKPFSQYKFANPVTERVYKKVDELGISMYEAVKQINRFKGTRGISHGQIATTASRKHAFATSFMLQHFAELCNTTVDYFLTGKEPVIDGQSQIKKLREEKNTYRKRYEDLQRKVSQLIKKKK